MGKSFKSAPISHPDDWSGSATSSSGFLHPESDLESNRTLLSSEWSRERSSQQSDLDNALIRRTPEDDAGGCCSVASERAVACLHVLDVSFGVSLVTYGSLMLAPRSDEDGTDRAMAAIAFCMTLGPAHLVTSALGAYSLFVGGCGRCGLFVSAHAGMYFALAYLTMTIGLLVDEVGFLTYLDDHKEVRGGGGSCRADGRTLSLFPIRPRCFWNLPDLPSLFNLGGVNNRSCTSNRMFTRIPRG